MAGSILAQSSQVCHAAAFGEMGEIGGELPTVALVTMLAGLAGAPAGWLVQLIPESCHLP